GRPIGRERSLLQRFEIGFQRALVGLRTLERVARRLRDADELLVDQLLDALLLRIEIRDRRVARADARAELGALVRHLGILRAQLPDGLRQHRFRGRAGFGAAGAPRAPDLLGARARLGGPSARGRELQRHLVELLLVDEHATGREDLVLLLVLYDAVFSLLDALAQR